jgi:pimeloyl-ACP methyl ester carboxylesterase
MVANELIHAQIEIDGLDTHYVRAGFRGPVVVVMHGGAPGACAMVNWGPNIVPLADAGFDVIAFDQPGYGGTANPDDYSMAFRITHAKAFIDALGLTRFHVMGNSQGSYLAARVALDDPRVDRLVLVSSGTLAPAGSPEAQAIARQHSQDLGGYEPGLENMRKLSQGTLFNRALVTEEFVQLRYEMSIGRLHEASVERRKAPRPAPITDELASLKPVTLLLSGLHDAGVPLERTQLLFSLLPHAEWHVFSDAAHWVQWDQAERFNTLVAGFLNAAR